MFGQEGGDGVSCIGQEELIFQLQCGVSITSVVSENKIGLKGMFPFF